MVKSTKYGEADRARGILSKRDREYLLGELDVEPRSQKERDIRAKIRERLWNAWLDVALLWHEAEHRDIHQTLGIDPQNGRTALARDRGIVHLFALLYEICTENRYGTSRDIEEYLRSGVRLAMQQRYEREERDVRWVSPPGVTLTIEEPDTIDTDELLALVDAFASADRKEQAGIATQFTEKEILLLMWIRDSLEDDRREYVDDLFGSWIQNHWTPPASLE